MSEILPTEAPAEARALFEKGLEALERDNLDYAMDLFEAALRIEPCLLQARRLLRGAAVRCNEQGGGGKKSFLSGLGGMVKLAGMIKKDPLKALAEAEHILRKDPANARVGRTQSDAALAAGLPEVSIQALELVREQLPLDIPLLERLAELYHDAGLHEQEYACRNAVVKLAPGDIEAIKRLKDAAARHTMGKGGWSEAGDFRDVLRDSSRASVDSSSANEEELLRERMEQEPAEAMHHVALSEFLVRNKRFDEAVAMLEAVEGRGGAAESQVVQRLHAAREQRLEYEVERCEDPSVREELTRQLQAMRLAEAARMVECYPNDLQLKFDYGKLLLEEGRSTEAIQQFQLAQANPQRRVETLHYLARAFAAKGQPAIAIEQLEAALGELPIMNAARKEALYELGCLCEQGGQKPRAHDCFKEIYAVDIAYRDVAERVERG